MHLDMWSYRQEPEVADSPNLAGYDVEAVDGRIGSVDDATYEAGGSYLVVDTGAWIFGKKVMLPAGVIDRIDHGERKIHVGRTQDEIKQAPEYEEILQRDPEYRDRLGEFYGRPSSVGNPVEPGIPNPLTG